MKISQLSARCVLSLHTLRFYEKNGLIESSERSASGYRRYNEADIRRVEFVKTARDAGFSLDEIARLLSIRLDRDHHTCEEVTAYLKGKGKGHRSHASGKGHGRKKNLETITDTL